MRESEEKLEVASDQKSRIRERYKGIDEDQLDVIPAIPTEDFYKPNSIKRVAVYARVSTDDPRQTSSYELQKNHYTDLVNRREDWKLVDIYADEGISGTSLKHRDSFIRMIADCKAGTIDLIVTKSVSRFARNVLDCIGYVRQLAAMSPPIGVFFETENIYTLNPNSEMSLSFISTLAQEESHNKSEIMNASIEMRFKRGIFLTPVLLGYDQDSDGNLIVNEEEAKIVRLIFFMYMYGYTCTHIAKTLEKLECKTKRGNITWSASTVLQILQNERHCGDVLAHKTWTPNYLDHKSKKNNGERAKVYQRDHHEPIISHDVFMAVQKMIRGSKYGGRGILPELQVISDGILNGYVVVNIHWAAFKAADCHMAYAKVLGEPVVIPGDTIQIEKQEGDFDLRGFEIARSQFFSTKGQLIITFTPKSIIFSTSLVRKFTDKMEIEILVHPEKKLIAIRPSQPASRNRIKWAKHHEGGLAGRIVTGTAFLPALYELFGWQNRWKYQIIGTYLQNGSDSIIVFDTSEAVVLVPPDVVTSQKKDITPLSRRGKTIPAYPDAWSESFGDDVYAQESSDAVDTSSDDWNAGAEGISYMDPEISVQDPSQIKADINQILEKLRSED